MRPFVLVCFLITFKYLSQLLLFRHALISDHIICRIVAVFAIQSQGMDRASAEVEAPLLSNHNSRTRENRWVIWRAVFNVSTTIIGAGIMSIPATLKVLGVVPAFVLIVLVALLVDITVNFMLRATYAGQSTTYAGLMKENFGKIGSLAVQICVMITTLGCLIMYLIIIGNFHSLMPLTRCTVSLVIWTWTILNLLVSF